MRHSPSTGNNKPTGDSWKEKLAYNNRLNNNVNEIHHNKSSVSSNSYNNSVSQIYNNNIVSLNFVFG